MTRQEAFHLLRTEMNKHGLTDWKVRQNQNPQSHFLGLCSHKDKCIILSAHHIDIHPTDSVINTIRHEVAHALVGPFHGHDDVWAAKARELGCDNTMPCSNLSLSPEIIDAIRSGADVEVTFDEHVIRTPKYTVTRLQDKCEVCGKVAVEKSSKLIVTKSDSKPDIKLIELECGHTITRNVPKGTPFHRFQAFGDESCQHVWNKNTCELCDRKRPFDYQLDGMKFLEKALAVGAGGCIFDEMGLGKTQQALGYLKFHPEAYPVVHLVKSGLKYQWASAIVNWMDTDDDMHIPQVLNTSQDVPLKKAKHYIISYDLLVPKTRTMKSGKVVQQGFDITKFDAVGVKTLVLDECQQIKNVDSARTQMVRRLAKGKKVIGLSGTPWNNRGSELFPILNMVNPMKFPSEEGFKRRWVNYYYVGQFMKEGGIKSPQMFKDYTSDICIRRERKEVMPELPTVNRTKLNVVFDPLSEKVYDEAVEEFVHWFEVQADNIGGMAIIAAMQKMRHLVAVAKMPTTLEYVDEFVEDTDRKLVVFAHHIDAQSTLFNEIKLRHGNEFPVLSYHAGLNAAEKFEVQEQFNRAPRAIMVASSLAAGEGLNLQTCSDCLIHERQWNPGKEEQQEGRFIRIGATADVVNSVYAHMQGLTTIDPQMDAIVSRKRVQFHDWTGSEAEKWNEDSLMKELAESIVRNHRAKYPRK